VVWPSVLTLGEPCCLFIQGDFGLNRRESLKSRIGLWSTNVWWLLVSWSSCNDPCI